ncbi:MAG: hypothetical protein HZC36_13800 [Armatimonadetes bacterium]|nr:hypothetical protein [Armatimonadota bacterium]
MKQTHLDTAAFAAQFSALWSEHCSDLSVKDSLAHSAGMARLFNLGFESMVATYWIRLDEKQQDQVNRLVGLCQCIERNALNR